MEVSGCGETSEFLYSPHVQPMGFTLIPLQVSNTHLKMTCTFFMECVYIIQEDDVHEWKFRKSRLSIIFQI